MSYYGVPDPPPVCSPTFSFKSETSAQAMRLDGLGLILGERTVFGSKDRNIKLRGVVESGHIRMNIQLPQNRVVHVTDVRFGGIRWNSKQHGNSRARRTRFSFSDFQSAFIPPEDIFKDTPIVA